MKRECSSPVKPGLRKSSPIVMYVCMYVLCMYVRMSFSENHNNHTNNTCGSYKMITMFMRISMPTQAAHKSTALPVKPGL